jgi:hypothetical protein
MTVTIPVLAGTEIILAFFGIVAVIMIIKWLIGIIF